MDKLMSFFVIVKKNKIKLLILILTLFIFFLLSSVYLINNNSNKPTLSNDLKGYSGLQQKIVALGSDPSVANHVLYQRLINKFQLVADKNLSEKERYSALSDASVFLQSLYNLTNNPKLRPLTNDFEDFAKLNFPKLHEKDGFGYYCVDPTCAQDAQPKEILQVITNLKASDFPQEIIDTSTHELLNIGYMESKYSNYRLMRYLTYSTIIRGYGSFSKSGANVIIANEIDDYVKSVDLNTFNKYQQSPNNFYQGTAGSLNTSGK